MPSQSGLKSIQRSWMQSPTLDSMVSMLRAIVTARTRSARERFVILGSFLECIETSLGKVLSEGRPIAVDRWEVELKAAGAKGSSTISYLKAIRERRNDWAHPEWIVTPDAERELCAAVDIFATALEDIYRGLADIQKHDRFAENLYETQLALEGLADARRFEAAVTAAFEDPNRRGECIAEAAGRLIAACAHLSRVRGTPAEHRVRHVAHILARTSACRKHLLECAEALRTMTPDRPEVLEGWIVSIGGRERHREGVSAVLRVSIERPPGAEGRYLIRNALLVTENGTTPTRLRLPIRVPSPEALVPRLYEIRKSFALAPSEVTRMVLQLDVPLDLVFEPFEDASADEYRLLTLFACITICPNDPGRFESASLGDVIAYPGADSTSVRFDAAPVGAIGDVVSGKLCVFAAEPAWRPIAGATSRIVRAFGPFPLAVLEHRADLDEPLEVLFGTRHEQPWFEFMTRITERRKTRGDRITVLWDDEEYSPPSAVSV